ncbi:MAG TPA: GNAT family N-acetyltransferase [Rhodocyclaceae bacterium]|nr:GNAT family N-acetyltransferase [Rhodocyclaceae bacterium]
MRIRISIPEQSLELREDDGRLIRRYAVSTAEKGVGEQRGSYQTPRGRHVIRAKIGAGQAENAVFVGRRPTGKIWSPQLGKAFPDRDWILTRILWLSGREPGFNRIGNVDTMRRYVYLHGSPDAVPMGVPGSHGCVRMRNREIIELFDLVPPYTPLEIVEYRVQSGQWSAMEPLVMPVREKVFVEEQGVPMEMERDEHDPLSLHVAAVGPSEAVIGTGRLLPDGHIGRLAVLPEWRGKGCGRALMDALLDAASEVGMNHFALHAQVSTVGFYRPFGFVEQGDVFMEAGIPHVLMTRATPA